MTKIGVGAIVHPSAELDTGVVIEPYAQVEANTVIGKNSVVGAFSTIHKNSTIGENNRIMSFSCIGSPPQIKDYDPNFKGMCILGDNNIIHQYVTISTGAQQSESGKTIIGSNNLFMAYTHIGHDSIIKDYTIFVNHATLGGHVQVDSYANVGALCTVHQYVHIGESAFIAQHAHIAKDVSPYIMVARTPAKVFGLNTTGLKRRGFSREAMGMIQKAYKILHRREGAQGNIEEQLQVLADHSEYAAIMLAHYKGSKRGLLCNGISKQSSTV